MNTIGRDNKIVNLGKTHSGDQVEKSERKRNAEQAHKGEQKNAAGDIDIVNISSNGAEKGEQIKQFMSMIRNFSDIRQDRVDKFTHICESGKYKIEPEKVAKSIVDEHLSQILAYAERAGIINP